MSTPCGDPDLVIVGGGPAGCAAALMAASLGLRSVLIESNDIGGRLQVIGALANVPGDWADGPSLANAVARDIQRIQESGHCKVVKDRAVAVSADGQSASVTLNSGSVVTGDAVIAATGVSSVTPAEADWISAAASLDPAPLWRARPTDLKGRTCVLGGDRPLGTWLRAHPDVQRQLLVVHPVGDDYKVAEVQHDSRAQLRRARHVTVNPAPGGGYIVDVEAVNGSTAAYACDTLLTNIGSRPAVLSGLTTDGGGYCPPESQGPRIATAGDLRSARFQRIVTAQGSGAQAVLSCYYSTALRVAA
ncbi:FAD-dependent oxidoreductase [Kitasatospora sp. NBC_01302]|uniref:FAD-dependent oxidoreductase n=1 Tax=Kitasatospora sp. NBC_01302 TaxID=2903575 RepID=UPI002E0E374B|nr:FAD-dependent oxidoreductase [Kitasatospora sp. NBC_01302]